MARSAVDPNTRHPTIRDPYNIPRQGTKKRSLAEQLAAAGRSRLLPAPYFLEQLRREQLRAFRKNQHLTVAVLSLPQTTSGTTENLYNLAKQIQLLIRETDLLGWHGHNAIAILITDTDGPGAKECVRRICDHTKEMNVECRFFDLQEAAKDIDTPQGQIVSDFFSSASPDLSTHSRSAYAFKRGLDIFGAISGMLFLSPIMLLAALAVKVSSPGPIIYQQVRLGQNGKPFVFYKFRSMRVDADPSSHRDYVQSFIKGNSSELNQGEVHKPFFKMKQDPRVTPVGGFLRKSSIDELPQLFNVLRGDMSLVGPRPPLPYEVDAYNTWHLRRILDVRPGLTGLWQVEGRSSVAFDDMVRLDLQYAQNWTILLDLKIILKTFKVVLQCRGSG
jgi:exopolysaccharide biosynthesis polyprenyl glycosylphosphotransferase